MGVQASSCVHGLRPSLAFPLSSEASPTFSVSGAALASELKARASLALHPPLGSAALTPLKLPSLIFWNCYRGCVGVSVLLKAVFPARIRHIKGPHSLVVNH